MLSGQPMQALVHLPRQSQQPSDRQLPRGECRYILRESDDNGKRQRCACVSYSLNSSIPGSTCGCGHQAWHHLRDPAGEYVSIHEHRAVLDKVRRLEDVARQMQDQAIRDRKDRETSIREMQRAYYQNLYHMRIYVDERLVKLKLQTDDKLESVEDKATEVDGLRKQVSDIDEMVMRMEEKLDNGKRLSRSLTPLMEGQASPSQTLTAQSTAELPFRTDRQHREAWDVSVILILSRHQSTAFAYDSIAWRRCQTRGLHQELHLRDRSSSTFTQCLEASFMAIFRRRAWMPMSCLRSSDMTLCQLKPQALNPLFWDYDFLESQCMAHDKLQGDVIYIALQYDHLYWDDIKALPCIFGSDESCWQYDEQLDAHAKSAIASEDQMDTDTLVTKATSEEYSPPPYSSRASMHSSPSAGQAAIRATALDVLATASSIAESQSSAASISDRSNHSAPSIISQRTYSTVDSIESTLAIAESDEHRAKRKRGIFQRAPGTAQIPPRSAPVSPAQPQIYYSGRVKRKINANTKVREPMDWRTSEISFKSLLHRNDGKEKRNSGAGPSQPLPTPQQQPQHQQYPQHQQQPTHPFQAPHPFHPPPPQPQQQHPDPSAM